MIRAMLTASIMLMASAGTTFAGPLEDADAAYNRIDYGTALRLWRQLADQGNPQAQNKLGEMYLNGLVEPSKGELVNCTEALKLFGIAANHGLAAAQYNLGRLYERGWCVSTDLGKARKFYRKAADQGDRDAASALWEIYEYGLGVRRDPAAAERWYSLANVNGQTAAPNRHTWVEVSLKKEGGTFVVPVEINGAITLDFTVDSGAADVSVPADVFSTLARTGTINSSDITGEQTYVLADGSANKSVTFTIRSLKVGNRVVENVRGSVAPNQGSLLLGQSFLEHFKSWSIDNTQHVLLLEPE
jgi:clan AA aspartic protease (TIGR02281 family)